VGHISAEKIHRFPDSLIKNIISFCDFLVVLGKRLGKSKLHVL
jgi:hypothetical protein